MIFILLVRLLIIVGIIWLIVKGINTYSKRQNKRRFRNKAYDKPAFDVLESKDYLDPSELIVLKEMCEEHGYKSRHLEKF